VVDVGWGEVRKYEEDDDEEAAEEYGDEGTYSLKCWAREPPLANDVFHW
jgi:hypothetical protein